MRLKFGFVVAPESGQIVNRKPVRYYRTGCFFWRKIGTVLTSGVLEDSGRVINSVDQCFGSGLGLDPDTIRSVDSESGS